MAAAESPVRQPVTCSDSQRSWLPSASSEIRLLLWLRARRGAVWHLRDLAYFVAVADHGNFTRAAENLFVSQPTLSKQIAALERSVSTPLFRREHDGVRLTRAGEALVPFARQLLATAAQAGVGGGRQRRVGRADDRLLAVARQRPAPVGARPVRPAAPGHERGAAPGRLVG